MQASAKPQGNAWYNAVSTDDAEKVETLIKADPNLIRQNLDMMQPVMYCSKHNKLKVLSILLQHGAPADGFDGIAPPGARYNSVMNAAVGGHAEACEMLLCDGKVDVNYRAHSQTALLLAAHYHHLSTIKVLDKYGADMNARSSDGSNAILETSRFTSHPMLIDYLVSRGVACDVADNEDMTAIMHLANIGDVESIRILVEKGGANLAHVNRHGDSVLSIAERRKMSEVVFYCWKRGLNPTNVSMQCHLGELNVTRPRAIFPLSGRYQFACAGVGSKIYVYGGSAAPQPKDTPTIQATLPPELEIVPTAEAEKSSSFDAIEPNRPGPQVARDPANPNMDVDGDVPGGAEEDFEEDGEDDGAELDQDALMEAVLEDYMDRINQERRANGAALLTRDEAFGPFLEALLGGQIDIGAALARIHARPGFGEDDGDDDDEDDESKDDGGSLDSETGQAKTAARKEDDVDRDEYSAMDADVDEDDYDAEDDNEFESVNRRLGTSHSYDTFVMDLDDCRMDYIFPNPQVQPKLQKIRLRQGKRGKFMAVDKDCLGGRAITPPADASFPPCLAIATHAFSASLSPFGYFELHVVDPGARRLLTMGLVPPRFPVEGKQPGWLSGSFGLHGDDGAMFHESGSGYAFSDRFEKGDVIGCGIYWPTREIFFSANGRFVGYSPTRAGTSRLYAAVGIRNENATFRVNFGAEPFRFDFRAPTISWNKIIGPEKAPTPRLEVPLFFNEPSGKYLVLLGPLAPASECFLFDLNHQAYLPRNYKGTPPQAVRTRAGVSWAQPTDRFVFTFRTRSKQQAPILGIFDTQDLEWNDIGGRYDDFVASKAPQAENAPNWMELLTVLDSDEFSSCNFMAINGQLVWTGQNTYLIVDPINGFYSQQAMNSKSVRFQSQDTKVSIGQSAITFGGWDSTAQSNDISVFNLETATWYSPSYTGVIPRPRNAHAGVIASTRSAYFGLNASDLPGGLLLPEPQRVIVHACGWSGRDPMSDIDIFSFSNATSDFAIDPTVMPDVALQIYYDPSTSNSMDTDKSLSAESLNITAHKILLFCRSSRFKEILQNPHAQEHQRPITEQLGSSQSILPSNLSCLYLNISESTESFKGLVQFLYSDTIPRDPSWLAKHGRSLARLVDLWAPELSPKLLERLLLNRPTLPSIFGSQLHQAFENSLFSDLQLEVEDDSLMATTGTVNTVFIPVHKVIITSRSPYFKALCTGGMAEASQTSIKIPDVPVEALKLVLEFLYTYEVPYDRCSDHIVDMFVLACRFQIAKLKSTLENLLIFNLAHDNVAGLLMVAHSQTSFTLLDQCIEFINNNKAEVESTPDFVESAEQIKSIMASRAQTKGQSNL